MIILINFFSYLFKRKLLIKLKCIVFTFIGFLCIDSLAADPDSDLDGMSDTWETSYGLNPLDANDRLQDLDGDRIPNVYEFANNSLPNNSNSFSAPHYYVDPVTGTNFPNDNIYKTITEAISKAPYKYQTNQYSIISVKAAVYNDGINFDGKRVLILGKLGDGKMPVLSYKNNTETIRAYTSGDWGVDGFIITHEPGYKSSGASLSIGQNEMGLLSHCVIQGNRYSSGAGIYLSSGKLMVNHCVIADNRADFNGNAHGIYIGSSAHLILQNSIVWNEVGGNQKQVFLYSAQSKATVTNSIILGGEHGASAQNPQLTPNYHLKAGSSARGAGALLAISRWDSDGEWHNNPIDIGIDQFTDSDSDGIADFWEMQQASDKNNPNDADEDSDGDGLTNLAEYEAGTDPHITDTDGDGLSDGEEVLNQNTSPVKVDTDGDEISDSYEVAQNLKPLDAKDKLEDKDGDRFPNIYEFANGSLANNVQNVPMPHYFVDPITGTNSPNDTIYTNIQAAINIAPTVVNKPNQFTIIQVKAGIYKEKITIDQRRILLLGEVGAKHPIVVIGVNDSALLLQERDCVVDGMEISRAAELTAQSRGVYVYLDEATQEARLVNCLIGDHNNSSSAGIFIGMGKLFVVHNTIINNSVSTSGKVIEITGSSGFLHLINSIVWNEGALKQIDQLYSTNVIVQNSIVKNGEFGALNQNPQLNVYGGLTSTSPAINIAATVPTSLVDIHNESRSNLSDIGVDEYLDSDGDGLSDWWEKLYGLNKNDASDAVTDNDNDALTNLQEFNIGSNPLAVDTDGDGLKDGQEVNVHQTDPLKNDTDNDEMSDSYELAQQLNPLNIDDKLEDRDGDRFPNVYEFVNNSLANDAGSFPAPHYIVDPVNGTNLPNDNVHSTIQQAINAAPTISDKPKQLTIIRVLPGTYTNGANITSRRIFLVSESVNLQPPVITRFDQVYVTEIRQADIVLDGFIIDRHPLRTSSLGAMISLPSTNDQARLVNCLVRNHQGSYGAFCIEKSKVVLAHCTLWRNEGYSAGAASIYSGVQLRLQNCIVWNEKAVKEFYLYDSNSKIISQQSLVRGGEVGGFNIDPKLYGTGFLRSSSPARDQASGLPVSSVDIHGEWRAVLPDIGADEYVDSDNDNMPDWWEKLYGFNPNNSSDADADSDNDGLTNFQESNLDTEPKIVDTDSDGLKDGEEVNFYQTDPLKVDTDGDEMSDGYEVQQSLNPLDIFDKLEDKDGDRFPNIYEFANNTLANNSQSLPMPHYTVDSVNGTNSPNDTIYTTIQQAIDAAPTVNVKPNQLTIIKVLPGVYTNGASISSRRIFLMGQSQSNQPPTLSHYNNGYSALTIQNRDVVIDGFIIKRHPQQTQSTGVLIYTTSTNDNVRLVNCLVKNHQQSNGALYVTGSGKVSLVHCTLWENKGSSAGGINLSSSSQLHLQNCIVWNEKSLKEFYLSGNNKIVIQKSLVRGGENGGLNLNPTLNINGFLCVNSPALNQGLVSAVSQTDIQGELREILPDIGADEWKDSDGDGLADWWEKQFGFDFLNTSNAQEDPDADQLRNIDEYYFGTNPLDPDTDDDGILDLEDIMQEVKQGNYPAGWFSDLDQDGLNYEEELEHGTNPFDPDTNGDGLWDKVSIEAGIDPLNPDIDGDGLNNEQEKILGTDPFWSDTDGDGFIDGQDAFPLDPNQSEFPSDNLEDEKPPKITLKEPGKAVLIFE